MTLNRKIGAGKIAIDHTYTPPEFRGNNIAFPSPHDGAEHRRRPRRRH